MTSAKVQAIIGFAVTVEKKTYLTISTFVLSDYFSHYNNRIFRVKSQKFSFKTATRGMRHENEISLEQKKKKKKMTWFRKKKK